MLPRLPLDLSTFAILRKSNYVYIDKTKYAYTIITGGRRYFLSRPRRFGKSLFISTLKEILDGNKNLFKGLWIEKSDYIWEKYGVIDLDLSSIEVSNSDDLRTGICSLLKDIAEQYELAIEINSKKPDIALRALARALYGKFGRVAVLVDEYDNPILQALNTSKKADDVRKTLDSFFTVIKSLDSFIDFVFITGVSSLIKAGPFPGANNFRIITMDKRFSEICEHSYE